ncbi:MAG: rsmE [Pseudonocardiales bacterium]|nr:rsmE [Pseudonocardiales bacterium]
MTNALFLMDELPAAESFLLGGSEGRHAGTVVRVQPGEQFQVGDGRGSVATVQVQAVSADGVQVLVLERRVEPPPAHTLIVVQALAKGDRAELAVETMTELGVDVIVPWSASRSIVRWRDDRADKSLARWRATAREATKQSRRAWAPEVTEAHSTAKVRALIDGADWAAALHEEGSEPLLATPLPPSGRLVLIVGPEGGIAGDELAGFVAAGARPVRLGDPVLRTSTAGAAALAALSPALGRWG